MRLENIRYYIDSQAGVVVAKCDCNIRMDALSEIEACINKSISSLKTADDTVGIIPVSECLFTEDSLSDTLMAKACCGETDTFDENIGKTIARRKLVAKYFKKKNQYITDYYNIFAALTTKTNASIVHGLKVIEDVNKANADY